MSKTAADRYVQPYLMFNGVCEDALTFYTKHLGAKVEFQMRYKESPEPAQPGMVPPGFENKIMHCSFRIGQSVLMASDGCSTEKVKFSGFSLSVSFETEAEARRAFSALSEGGQVSMPIGQTFWSPCFGMVTDRFGMNWMITLAQ